MMDPMEKFEQAVWTALGDWVENFPEEGDVNYKDYVALKAVIMAAADSLLEDVATALCEAPVEAVAMTLLGIYRSGHYPGRLVNDKLHEAALLMQAAHGKVEI